MNTALIIRILLIIIYIALIVFICELFYEYHFCPGILHLYQIPDEGIVAGIITCVWGIVSTIMEKKLNTLFWIKSVLIVFLFFNEL